MGGPLNDQTRELFDPPPFFCIRQPVDLTIGADWAADPNPTIMSIRQDMGGYELARWWDSGVGYHYRYVWKGWGSETHGQQDRIHQRVDEMQEAAIRRAADSVARSDTQTHRQRLNDWLEDSAWANSPDAMRWSPDDQEADFMGGRED